MERKTKRNIRLVLLAVSLLALLLFWKEQSQLQITEIQRNDYGDGKRKEQLEVTIGEEQLEEKIELEIHERIYSEEKLKSVFGQAMDDLSKLILGKNKSLDHVEYDLNLITRMPDSPIEIRWESGNSKLINSLGELQEENLKKDGEMVELEGVLRYRENEALYLVNVMVYPRKLSKKEELIESVRKSVLTLEEEGRESSVIKLPNEVNGKKLIWEKRKEYKSFWILFLGCVAAMLLYVQEKQTKEKQLEMKRKQMQIDYPEIVNGIALLVGAGLTVKNAWRKIVENYEEQSDGKKKRYAYEEMISTIREMQGGVSEAECYEHFGQRTGLSSYVKLGTILSQNLRKGAKGLTDLLTGEARRAYEERRQIAKKQGEEVSTKLLLPMSFMLIIVLVIVIVPAFLSVSF